MLLDCASDTMYQEANREKFSQKYLNLERRVLNLNHASSGQKS